MGFNLESLLRRYNGFLIQGICFKQMAIFKDEQWCGNPFEITDSDVEEVSLQKISYEKLKKPILKVNLLFLKFLLNLLLKEEQQSLSLFNAHFFSAPLSINGSYKKSKNLMSAQGVCSNDFYLFWHFPTFSVFICLLFDVQSKSNLIRVCNLIS